MSRKKHRGKTREERVLTSMRVWAQMLRLPVEYAEGLDVEQLADLVPEASSIYGPKDGFIYFVVPVNLD